MMKVPQTKSSVFYNLYEDFAFNIYFDPILMCVHHQAAIEK